jgi:type II secretory pathway component PulF
VAGGYLAALSVYGVKKWRTMRREREALFSLPLTLESLILLVEAGVGLLPAIRLTGESLKNPVTALLCRLHRITDSGVPFSDALREVATHCDHPIQKHVLLHLHVASSEGGALASALRNLSDYAHLEWKLAIERRVRKLENTVVFPVFVGVLGLLLLSAAAPIVPLLELRDNLGSNNLQSSGWHARRTDAAPLTGEKQ